jgi:alcohol dehydrogenase class IV
MSQPWQWGGSMGDGPSFSFFSPVRLVFGQPVADALPAALVESCTGQPEGGERRALLISDPGLVQLGLVARIAEGLGAAGWSVAVFSEVQSNPTVRNVEAGVAVARSHGACALVALGGGSAIDVGKAVGLLLSQGGAYADYQWHGRPIQAPITPLVAVPTTAGTGSEMTQVTVIGDEETHFKKGVRSPHLFPRVAVVDPALTWSVPSQLTAATGADVLVHALEAFVGRSANPVTDALALAALERAWRYLPRAVQQRDDREARREMALASSLAGLAFDQSGLGIIHSLAGPLAANYDLHHGLSNGLLLPSGLAYNLPALGLKRRVLLRVVGADPSASDEEVILRVKDWVRALGLPLTLGELGITDPDLPAMAEEAGRMVLLPNNPRPASAEDCLRILEALV